VTWTKPNRDQGQNNKTKTKAYVLYSNTVRLFGTCLL